MGTYTQDNRLIKLNTPLGKDVLLLRGFTGQEGISKLFRFSLDLFSENRAISFPSIVGKKATVSIQLPDKKVRYINGLVDAFSQGGTSTIQIESATATFASYSAILVPWLTMLGYTSDCRIFQHKSVPDIIEAIFKEYSLSDFKNRLQGSFAEREYCVQWNETDLQFVSRLMEEEGIFYFFEHDESSHTLIMANKPAEFKPCPLMPEARYEATGGAGKVLEVITEWNISNQVRPGKFETKDFNFEDPTLDLTQSVTGKDERKFEIRTYPGDYLKMDEGERIVGIRMEELETPSIQVQGAGSCRGFVSGFRFDLKDYYRRDTNNKPFLLTQMDHRCSQGDNFLTTGTKAQEAFLYENRFQCVPHPTAYRPPRLTKRPYVQGNQTAIVVGPAGEEIFVDKYGRVKVQFHWDREGKYDDKSSCWIRTCQPAAGKGWGFVWIPRIGQEVVVDFTDGNPDRPIITGRVYNGESMPPYALPKEMTKSAMKTYSSKGGGGFNEIRFEDKKGQEQVFIHGETDLDVRIKNDRREWIGRDRNLIVKRDKKALVERDEKKLIKRHKYELIQQESHLTVQQNQAIKVDMDRSLTVGQNLNEKIGMIHAEEAGQIIHLKSGMTVVIEAGLELTLKAGANFIDIGPAGIAISGTPMVMINSGGAAGSGPGASPTTPQKPEEKDVEIADNADPGSKEPSFRNQRQTAQATLPPSELAAANAPWHDPNSEENKEKKHWIEIELVDKKNKPVPGEKYRVTLPDGTTVAEGTLDSKGHARVDGIDPGTCKVTFPNLDKNAWKPK